MAYIVYDKKGNKVSFNHKIDVKEAVVSGFYFLKDPTKKEDLEDTTPPIIVIEKPGPLINDKTIEQGDAIAKQTRKIKEAVLAEEAPAVFVEDIEEDEEEGALNSIDEIMGNNDKK